MDSREGCGALGGRGGFGLAENFADAQDRGIGDGDAHRALAAKLRETVFEMNVLAGVAGEGRGDAHMNVGGAITNFHTFTEEVGKR